jgi:hypothetical protein
MIEPGTVVTPLAREYLKHRGIEIRLVGSAEEARGGIRGGWGFVIDSDTGVLEAFRRSLLEDREPWSEVGRTLRDAVEWVSEEGLRGALIVTTEGAAAVYRACQAPSVRAAAADEPTAVARAARGLGMNLLVIEPLSKSIALLRQMSSAFRRAGTPQAPAWLDAGPGVIQR